MWIIINLLMIMIWSVRSITLNVTAMRWVDNIEESDMDIMFDRAVIITILDDFEDAFTDPTTIGVALGVFVSNDTVLTSYNPFRKYVESREERDKLKVSVIDDRHITDWKNVTYNLSNYTVVCGRQVMPTADEDNIWHDDKKQRSPLHDLMVLRLNTGVVFLDPNPNLYSFNKHGKSGTSTVRAGPLQTEIATIYHALGRDMKFASLGFIDKPHMKRFLEMRSRSYAEEDNVLTSCDRWLPRQWGIFLCVKNEDNYPGLGSSALLFYDNILFGVGCCMLKKGKDSILIFTDVRQYYHLINETCSWEDQNLQNRTTTTTTTTSTTTVPP